jgi:hypothetical protein
VGYNRAEKCRAFVGIAKMRVKPSFSIANQLFPTGKLTVREKSLSREFEASLGYNSLGASLYRSLGCFAVP